MNNWQKIMKEKSSDELKKILYEEYNQYNPEVIEFIKNELTKRGESFDLSLQIEKDKFDKKSYFKFNIYVILVAIIAVIIVFTHKFLMEYNIIKDNVFRGLDQPTTIVGALGATAGHTIGSFVGVLILSRLLLRLYDKRYIHIKAVWITFITAAIIIALITTITMGFIEGAISYYPFLIVLLLYDLSKANKLKIEWEKIFPPQDNL